MSSFEATGSLSAAERMIEIGRPERALAIIADLDADLATSHRARELRGWALIGLERWDEVVEVAGDALDEDPEDIGALYMLSLAHEQLDQLAEAERAILAALALNPDAPELLCQYADVTMRGGQLDKAERLLGRAAAVDPESPDVRSSRIDLAYLRGRRKEAEALTHELLARDPESLRGHRMLGVLNLEGGKPRLAEERFAEAVRADPAHAPTAAAARVARELSKPWWWPLRMLDKLGVAGSWIAAMAVIFGLRAAGLGLAAGIATIVWLALCAYSWIAGPILNRRVDRLSG